MSDANNGSTPPEKPLSDGPNKTGRLNKAKRIGWITFASAATAMVIITLFALVSAKSGSGLIISINRKDTVNHFTMGLQPKSGGQGGGGSQTDENVLIGEPLGSADLVAHTDVQAYYNAKIAEVGYSDGKLSGSWNYKDAGNGTPYALFYTFYLNNTSLEEAQPYKIAARLNTELTQAPESYGRRPYDFVRLGVYLGNDGEPDSIYRVFANDNTLRKGTTDDPNDYRECLGKTRVIETVKETEEGPVKVDLRYAAYTATFAGKEIAFCESFDPGADGLGLFSIEDTIDPGKSRRVTFFTYLEGDDPDTNSGTPINQSLGFSLSIGI